MFRKGVLFREDALTRVGLDPCTDKTPVEKEPDSALRPLVIHVTREMIDAGWEVASNELDQDIRDPDKFFTLVFQAMRASQILGEELATNPADELPNEHRIIADIGDGHVHWLTFLSRTGRGPRS